MHAFLDFSVSHIQADTVQSSGISGAGVKVCVVDTGVDDTHPSLNPLIAEYDFVNGDNDATDDEGHGTHVAGIIASRHSTYKGVAPDASLMAAKVLDNTGTGFMSDVIAGIDWCVANGADVINLSLGGGVFVGTCDSQPDAIAVNNAVDAGVVVAVASGNDGYINAISSPACASKAIAVGALDDYDGRTPFSNEGIELDVVALGVNIRSLNAPINGGDFVDATGTSMATPHVAGLAALLSSTNPYASSTQISSIIKTTSLDLGASGFDTIYGYGRIQANNAYQNMLSVLPQITISPSEGSTVEGNSRFQKILFTGNVQNRISGFNNVTLALGNSTNSIIYNAVIPLDVAGSFSNEFNNSLYTINMPGSGLYNLTVSYDGVQKSRSFSYLQTWNLTSACASHDFCTFPFNAVIPPDGRITYYNADVVPHSITSGTPADGSDGKFDSGILYPDGSTDMGFPYTVFPVGVYPYFDSSNPALTGTITITDISTPPQVAYSIQATGLVNILGTCGLSFPNGNSVNYGSLTPNTISQEIGLNMTNSGTTLATLQVSGTNWLDGSSNPQMLVNRTHYNVTSGTYSQKTPLQSFDQLVTSNFVPSVILQTFWHLQTILLNQSFTGATTQTMDFTVSC
ncbi:S8 family serine peptidase [Candidatus Nitrosotenuis sp. DW1]|uniref:S8 family serine peptidase n=1 Tax=Candidatus Nitrosotenuis sp. DW1 TaxID=2259672 RepID=UPI0015C9857D|nr:S8 family serine peptidase [Candidatus Nitrosotenuis sp. DW1]QLH08336.1 hypothetical protein DSQ19_01525 [Candidatus Nitrosotenuis sp. DW1]